jgi:hypothetical protein
MPHLSSLWIYNVRLSVNIILSILSDRCQTFVVNNLTFNLYYLVESYSENYARMYSGNIFTNNTVTNFEQ